MSFTPAEVDFLAKHQEEIAHLDLTLTKASRLKDTEILKAKFGEYGRAVMELVTARSSGKLPHDWLMDADSAQQATPPRSGGVSDEIPRRAGRAQRPRRHLFHRRRRL